ncbi:signal peptide protein [Paenibacillus profundus]|uniref:Signal peptide protein n=1 Tax=Paenibacillus profundus TaxID=1173085 RepID=A0ABS8YGI9_9BACL|nr:hypothetical protein [Paenibacillus profundus]MCE5170044.1 signal peptide protein [Paenibacillus profundus]
MNQDWNRQRRDSNRYRKGHSSKDNQRTLKIIIAFGVIIFFIVIASQLFNSGADDAGYTSATATNTVPWDYKIDSATVGDIIGGDMTLLPDNELLPNDNNYATGDKIWTLQYMTAEMIAGNEGRNDVRLSSWEPIKSYPSKQDAEKDLQSLKVNLSADVELLGVYKTEYQGKFRQFAVMTLPSGHTVKQPIDEARYLQLKDKKKVKAVLEEVHDFVDYDLAMAKFRGWAD